MLTIKNLRKRYGNFQALDGLNLEVADGELFGFVGPNGAGKTTTLKILAGLLVPDEGEVEIGGLDVYSDGKELRRRIGYVPDFFGVYDNLKVSEYMEFFASCYGITGLQARTRCHTLLEQVRLEDKEDFFVDGLSRGMKQRLCLARALIHDPDLLILDIMLPDGNGLDICRRFREKTMRPVLFLTGKGDVRDKVEGLQQGGDYYLTKPYNFDEFLAVIQMLLARQKRLEENFQASRQITIGSLRLDLSDGHAYLNNADTGLTRTEFSLLRLLAENQEKIFSAKELYEAVWDSCAGTDTSTVRRHIFNLRTKIGAEDTDEYDIVSVYGKGYLFTCR